MADEVKYLSKVQLSDGSVYYLKDLQAFKTSGGTITGDTTIDTKLTTNKLYILSIETITVSPTNVLVQNESSGEIMKRDTDELLQDIGGYSCDESALTNGILKLKLGK